MITFYDEATGSVNKQRGMDAAQFYFSKAFGMASHSILLQVTGKADCELCEKNLSEQPVSKELSVASSPACG